MGYGTGLVLGHEERRGMLVLRRQAGVTLVEMMIGIAIALAILVWGMPTFSLWLQGAQNRTAAESIQSGLQLARAEAVQRNALVRFNLTDASGKVAWTVGCVTVTTDCPAKIQERLAEEGSVNARVGISVDAIPNPAPTTQFNTVIAGGAALPAGVTFDGMGRVPSANIGSDITRMDVTNAVMSTARRLVVTVGTGGQIRMCDPALSLAANPQGCA